MTGLMNLAKTTRPTASRAIRRSRLFRLLDANKTVPITWIQGPPGIGKTTLVASYVSERRLRTVWYQVDAADGDVASFFYYLSLTVPRRRHRLPLLTPEAQSTLNAFARRFFRELYAGFRAPFAIVFDNYQDAPANAALHNVMREALAEIPRGGRAFILSRGDPPGAFSRLRASGAMHVVDPNELLLNRAESRQVWRRLVSGRRAAAQAGVVHQISGGWAAGLVLLAEHVKTRPDELGPQRGGYDVLFEYFARELLDQMNPDVQQVLLSAAFVPRLTGPMASELARVRSAGDILLNLYQNGYFITRHAPAEPGGGPVYEFHPLFRSFLAAEGRKRLRPTQRRRIGRVAARILERDGSVEGAALLFQDAEDWKGLATLIRRQAQTLLSQGRSQTLLAWLAALPPQFVEPDPWMRLWRAGCQIASDPPACRDDCNKAIGLFRRVRDAAGAYLAWCTATFSIAYESVSATLFDPWLSLFDTLRREFPEFPSEDIEARVANSMLLAVAWRQPQHPDAESWAQRAFELSRDRSDVNARAQTLWVWVMHHVQNGDFQSAVAAVPELWQLAKARESPPLTAVIARVAIAWTWVAGEKDSHRAATEGFALAKSARVINGDCECLLNLAAIALDGGDADTATRSLREVEKRLGRSGRAYLVWYHTLVSWEGLVRNDSARAASAARSALQWMETGRPWDEAVTLTVVTQALHESGANEDARQQLSHLLALAERMRSPLVEFMARLVEAHVAFDQQRDVVATASLARAMLLGRLGGYFHMYGWRSSVMSRLCARALDAGVEIDYVRSLIQTRRLAADVSVSDLEIWPWPIRIYTLGRFEVVRDDMPLTFSRKVQRRTLALLKTLIAFGGRDVREETIIDALWHDSEGDAAHLALTTALHRLRALLGRTETVTRQGRRVGLNPQFVWIDTWAVDRILDRAESVIRRSTTSEGAMAASLVTNRALGLYRGPCLGGEAEQPWARRLDERLTRRLRRQLQSEGAILARGGERQQALDRYEKAAVSAPRAPEVTEALAAAQRRVASSALRGRRARTRV